MRHDTMVEVVLDIRGGERHRLYEHAKQGWVWAGFLFMSAILMQVVLQAQAVGQTVRGTLLGWQPAALFGGRAFLLVYNIVLLLMLGAAIRAYGRDRCESWRTTRPISYWAFVGGIALRVGQVAADATGVISTAGSSEPITVLGRQVDPMLLRFDLDLWILVAMALGFIGLEVARDLPTRRSLQLERERTEKIEVSESLLYMSRAERMYGIPEDACAMLEEAISFAEASGDRDALLRALADAAECQQRFGQYGKAVTHYQQIVSLTWAKTHAKDLEDATAAVADAKPAARWALALGDAVDARDVAEAMRGLGAAILRDGDRVRAATLFGIADCLRDAEGTPLTREEREERERTETAASRGWHDDEFWTALARGRSMPPAEAFRFAVQAAERPLAAAR